MHKILFSSDLLQCYIIKKNTGLNSVFKLNNQRVLLEYKKTELYQSMDTSVFLENYNSWQKVQDNSI